MHALRSLHICFFLDARECVCLCVCVCVCVCVCLCVFTFHTSKGLHEVAQKIKRLCTHALRNLQFNFFLDV